MPISVRAAGDSRASIAALAILVLLGAALRVGASRDAFWLDEIWSYYLAQIAESPWQVFSRIRHDNNHILNTLFIHLLGEQQDWTRYRLLSIVTGALSVGLIGLITIRPRPAERIAAVALTALSYPLIHYSSEARGYAPAVFFALAAFLLARRYCRTGGIAAAFGVWASLALGLLSHLTFVFVFAALVGWAAVVAWRERGPAAALTEALTLFAVPAAFFLWLHAYYYSAMVLGGGATEYSLLAILREGSAVVLGAPPGAVLSAAALGAVVAVIGIGLMRLWRQGRSEWVAALAVIFFLSPLLVVVTEPPFLSFRYLLLAVPFLHLLLAHQFADLVERRGGLGLAGMAALAVVLAGHGWHFVRFLDSGRGDYPAAIAQMREDAAANAVSVGSDHDFRNALLVEFYEERAAEPRLAYLKREEWPESGPDWFIRHSLGIGDGAPPQVSPLQGTRYELVGAYPFYGLSGWNWFLYRRTDPPPATTAGPS